MFTIIHGDDTTKVYEEISRCVDIAKKEGKDIVRLSSKTLSLADLENSIGTSELYVTKKIVIVSGLLSLPKSKKKDEYLLFIRRYEDSTDINVVCTEFKLLTPLQQKAFPKAITKVFKYPQLLFEWLEGLGIATNKETILLFHRILEQEDVFAVFSMFIRQIRMLLMYKSEGRVDGSPFMQAKISKQARGFTMQKLLSLHQSLLSIDLKSKSSDLLDMTTQLDLLLSTM